VASAKAAAAVQFDLDEIQRSRIMVQDWLRMVPRGEYVGERAAPRRADEAEHFIRCPACQV
jgi:hypothetical protein